MQMPSAIAASACTTHCPSPSLLLQKGSVPFPSCPLQFPSLSREHRGSECRYTPSPLPAMLHPAEYRCPSASVRHRNDRSVRQCGVRNVHRDLSGRDQGADWASIRFFLAVWGPSRARFRPSRQVLGHSEQQTAADRCQWVVGGPNFAWRTGLTCSKLVTLFGSLPD